MKIGRYRITLNKNTITNNIIALAAIVLFGGGLGLMFALHFGM